MALDLARAMFNNVDARVPDEQRANDMDCAAALRHMRLEVIGLLAKLGDVQMDRAHEQEQSGEPSVTELLISASKLCKRGDYSKAYEIYYKLAQSGHSESQVFLGWMYSQGKGVRASPEEAEHWYTRAAKLRSASGAFYLGGLLARQGRFNDAIAWYKKSANAGYSPSQFRLGVAYLEGRGVPKDLDMAVHYLEVAKRNGNVFAWRNLAVLDIKGRRGMLRRIIGIIDFSTMFLSGVVGALWNPHSDDLRG
ncbi:sel1 repeat family protein [Ralstonia sp. CHL-2022]|uniref:Sel1 repeat family protein n=1 Tax=Ralstonia mojiangensis TaxID=2953895 RepID=A0AAE3LG61_9RALS|nr:tetratricopeptide repeat protein [Ralstonia mojiangensis]MCT7319367.1 sel1 repeat family protein [Ralstonia mojiangensis]